MLLDKYNNKLSTNLIEHIINTCKRLKFIPFEESVINNTLFLINNTYTALKYNKRGESFMMRK